MWSSMNPRTGLAANRMVAVLLIAAFAGLYLWAGRAPRTGDSRRELVFWCGWTGNELAVVQGFVDKFNAAHPATHVKMVSIANSYQKMKIAFAGDDTPDVCATVWTHELPDYAMRGVLEPLDPYLAHSTRKPADYYESVWKTYQYEGLTYALSQTMITFFIAYNKAAFREAGLDPEQPPRTLEEFDAMAERCTRWRGGKPGGELERLGFPYGDLFTWGMAFGADYWNEPRRRLTVDTPQMVACLDWMKRNVDKYGLERVRAFKASFGNATSPNNPFITGKVAMMPVGDWYRSIIEEYAPRNFEWGWFAMPAPAGGRPNSTFLMSSMFVIPKAGRQKQEAWEFIEYMTSAEVAENIHVGDSPADLTALKESAAKPQFDEPYWHFVEGLLLSRNAMPPPKIPLFDRFISELSRVEDYVMAGARTPQAALADMQVSFQHELDLAHKTVRDRTRQADQPAGAGLPGK